ncbi:hypothetical protein [Zunongwangia endophytica]|uniref:N-acetyltransferase domain-containing protein n=1 Tax=Zunongwangia endophytica TaxID=1808945 RepID=A0ABV8H5A0_9FLAO|nr:hypothetical protein [Zunongwangia endophytica]MDN3595217.1 hypothetical protein [Zunongwangia endophytica]
MKLLGTYKNLKYYLSNDIDPLYFSPILAFVKYKLEVNWDDYNEFFHACRLFENLKKNDQVIVDSHLLFKDGNLIGCAFIVRGNIADLEERYKITEEKMALQIKYFHITEKGNGYGKNWLKDVIIPYYSELQYKRIYVNSSHPLSFPFYERLGEKIANYTQHSDNNLRERKGASFLLRIAN